MKPSDNTKIYETEIGTMWFDEDGILCQISKQTPRTMDRMKQHIYLTGQISHNKKVCVIADATHAAPSDKQVRDYIGIELQKSCKALAILSNSVLGTMIANILILLKGQVVPMKMFTDEKKAKEWLKQFV